MNKFQELGLSAPVIKAISALGIENPTQIQQEAIPKLLQSNCDFIGLAHTGTGKTAAFGLPLVELVDRQKPVIQALIVVPTRELGQQVAQQLEAFSKGSKGIRVQVVFGGKPIMQQMRALRQNPQILVATPGRLIDLINRKAVKLGSVERIILDEADEMLNMGFQEDIDKILSYAPEGRNIWLFSATMPAEIRQIVDTYMNNPEEVAIQRDEKVNQNISHQYMGVKSGKKNEALLEVLYQNPDMRAVVFCRTKRDTQEVANELRRADISADAIHGDLSQHQRDRAMKAFKAHKLQTLVATDVAARGIDVNDVTHVIHHSLPDDMSFYAHRSGRTARAGKKGISLAIVSRGDVGRIQQIERKLSVKFKDADILLDEVTEILDFSRQQEVRDRRSGRGGGRGRNSGGGRRSSGGGRFSRNDRPKTKFNGEGRDNQEASSRRGKSERSTSDSPRANDSRNGERRASGMEGRKKRKDKKEQVWSHYSSTPPQKREGSKSRNKRKRIGRFAD